ncbi:MAG: porin [Bacteroidetes bacterium]|nr:porin [Bacteroidota bacterium]
MLFSFSILLVRTVFSQEDSTQSPLKLSAYIETYYLYNFSKPSNHTMPAFMYSYNRHNEINLNLGFVKAAYQTKKIRANLALAAGTYVNANYASEPGVLKNIYEANVGVKISKKHNLWVDAGIFASHIGFEDAVGKDNWTLTRSILADNSPYYESGVKISYTSANGKWFASALLLNGWQHIQRINGNNSPAFGHQLTYTPSEKCTINSSSFIGNTKPDSAMQMRYFHNLYGIFQLTKHWGLTLGFDVGAEQKNTASSSYNTWYAPVLIAKFNITEKHALTLRGEYYNDAHNVIVKTAGLNGFKTWGYSLNYDYIINHHIMWRIEGRAFSSTDPLFILNNKPSFNTFFVTSSLAVSF